MNKRIILFSASLALCALGLKANAQISQGGLPLSFQKDISAISIPINTYTNPDWSAFLESEKKQIDRDFSTGGIQVGLPTAVDFGFPASGQMVVADNGVRVWRGIISIDNAPAMGLYFNSFQLPKGVKLFVSNENKKQVAGAFDVSNNDASGVFAIDAVQGSKLFVELNIESGVNIDDIKLHVDNILVMHRAIEHLQTYTIAGGDTPLDQYDASLNGNSSVCMINAICATEANAVNPRKSTVQTIHPSGGACSGTLVNNTSNVSGGTCKPLIVTASHCETTGETSNSSTKFSQLIVRFNFERPDCPGTAATNGQSISGVNLISRSAMQTSWASNVSNIKGDFMLYELKQQIPASYGAVLSGWKSTNETVQTTAPSGKMFIGFHHPVGDNKKVTKAQSVESYSWPNQFPSAGGTRWLHMPSVGYVSPGSSGSGLFDGDGYLIGIASVAGVNGNIPANCQNAAKGGTVSSPPMDAIIYQKMSQTWNYNENGITGSNSFKPFLDPANTGLNKINSVNAVTCTPLNAGGGTDAGVSINDVNQELASNISVFPNPNSTGKVQLQYNFKSGVDMSIEVVDITGKVVFQGKMKDAKSGTSVLDLSSAANGMYIIKISSTQGFATKKIMLNK